MIYPAQTSLIPVQIALARFLEQGGSLLGNYPYWYLGTTPYRYLTGPIVPLTLVGLHKIFSFLSLFEIFFLLIGISFLIGVVGTYFLVKEISKEKGIAILATFFYVFGPIVPLLFRFSDGLYLMSFSVLPYLFWLYFLFLQPRKHGKIEGKHRIGKIEILLCLLIAFVMLIDSLILPTLILGMAAIFLVQVGWKKAEEKIKSSLVVLFFSLLVATLWYSPGYWLTLLGAPSLAGKGLVGVIFQLGKLLPTVLAFGIAIFSVRFFKKKNLLRDFCFYWLFIFGFLSLLRFLSDPDFWMDWVSYSSELQLGLSILGALVVERLMGHPNYIRMKIVRINPNIIVSFVLCCLLFVLWAYTTNKYVLGTLQRDISQTVEYRVGRQLSEIAKDGDRVFLSGTTTFWFNAFFDIPQVRGGVDQVSVDQEWRKAVWEIRQGATTEGTEKWLKTLNISYLVVHTEESEEFYHDFKYPEKFEGVEGFEKVYDEQGDIIYRVLQKEELDKEGEEGGDDETNNAKSK